VRVTRLALAASLALLAMASASRGADKPVLGTWGVETQHISRTVKPGDDFYRYVNEGWLKTARPPAGLPYANAFVDAYLRTQGRMQTLIDRILASRPEPGTDEDKIASLYRSYVDVGTRNARGLAPIAADLAEIAAIQRHEDAARLMARSFYKSPIGAGVTTDKRDPQRYVIAVGQGGLGLPGREYYLTAGEPFDGHRAAYLAYIADVFRRAGIDGGEAQARAIMDLETKIAASQWTLEQQRDPVKGYRAMTLAEIEAYAPGFPWPLFFAESGIGAPDKLVLQTDTAIRSAAALFGATDVATLRSYLTFHYISEFAPLLSADWEAANFAFYGTRLGGIIQPEALPNRAQGFLSRHFGEILGRAYTRVYFPASHREQMDVMVRHLREAFRKRFETNPWMDEPTRKGAIVKLEAIVSHIGYPDKWRDWSAVRFDAADLVGNRKAIARFEEADAIAKLREPRRDWQWGYAAHEINAGYSPQLNSITFPAGILQSPFFDPAADPAVNYGSIGAVIGHEIGHAFDDQGSQSDEKGALRNWWTGQARAEFNTRADMLVEQYNAFTALPGMQINGRLTLGENIGDLGGVNIALEAYRAYVAEKLGGTAPVIDGFTGEQRFFLSWGQLWRDVTEPAALRRNLLTDVHSPNEFRVRGTVRNTDGWYAAFGVREGDAMYLPPDKRVTIW
jgi:endothelin-converting enzyme/putative endopeptidase